MSVITKNAEEELLQNLKKHWDASDSSRCIYIKLSSFDKNAAIKPMEEVRNFFDERQNDIFICHDRDVFVVNGFATQKIISDFLTHLQSKLSEDEGKENVNDALVSLFEVNMDWRRLKNICERKIEERDSKNTPAKKKKTNAVEFGEKEKQEIAKLQKELASSLSQRRQDRKETKILVVEDDLFSQRLVKNTLKERHTISTAENAKDAFRSYIMKAPDILFLDIGLPDMDGLQVLQKIFEIDPDAFIVMLSGNGHRENVLKAVERGAKGFVAKPFTKEKLFQYIEKSPFVVQKMKMEHLNDKASR